jgi:hypothetical protein
MVGGPQAVFEQLLPILQLMGKNITRVGENGDGQTAKVANQIIVALTIEAVGEACYFRTCGCRSIKGQAGFARRICLFKNPGSTRRANGET